MEVKNELGLIVEFVRQATAHGFEILSITGDRFPDAIVQKDGVEYRTEFEFRSSNFNSHRHDVRDCDLIVCWENDAPDFPIPVIALTDSEWHTRPITMCSADKKEAYYWKARAYRAERRLSSSPKDQPAVVAEPKVRIYYPIGTPITIEQRQDLVRQMDADGLTNEQIATLIGVSLGTVKNDKKIVRQQAVEGIPSTNGNESNEDMESF